MRDACRPLLGTLARDIKTWADKLPPEKAHLFPGVKVGWEASIGINAYHYVGGNRYLKDFPNDPTHDPQTGLKMGVDFAGGAAPLGYAALTAKNWKHSGPVTLGDHERVVSDYLDFLARTAREVGLSRDEIFTHAGGQYAPWKLHYSHRTPVNKHSLPGWSLYNTAPEQAGDLADVLRKNKQNRVVRGRMATRRKNTDGMGDRLPGPALTSETAALSPFTTGKASETSPTLWRACAMC